MKILVTGANGYLGLGIVKSLLCAGNEVVATDIRMDLVDERAEKKAVDLFALDSPYEYFGRPDVLLHLAWRDGFSHFSNAHINDLPKHFQFIEKMAEAGIHKIAVMGTMHEIGFYEGSIDENTPCRPVTPYGIGKNALRELTQMVTDKNKTIFQWLRAYYIVGNTSYGNSIFSKIVAAAEKGEKEFPFTTGKNQYDFLDYDRFCFLTSAVVNQEDVTGVINICTGYPESLANRVERFLEENQLDIQLNYGAFPDREYDSKAVWGNDFKIRKIVDKM